MNKQIGVVPQIISTKHIKFIDTNGVEIVICEKSPFLFIQPEVQPYIEFDTFASKTSKPERLIFIDYSELEKLDFFVYSVPIPINLKWYPKQRIMYILEKRQSPPPGGKKVQTVMVRIQKDISNNKIRILGKNAGYPHFYAEGGCSPWKDLEIKKEEITIK